MTAVPLVHISSSANRPLQLKAKALYEHELALLHTRRAEREKAADALRLRAASPVNLVDTLSATELAAPKATTTTTEDSGAATTKDAPRTQVTSVAALHEPVKPLSKPVSATPASGDPSKAITASNTASSAPPAPGSTSAPTPGLDHVSDLDFDSMFADTSAPEHSTNIDFDLDFSTSDNPFADLTAGNDFTVTNTSTLNGVGLRNTSGKIDGLGNGDVGGDIDSLMPGIESYVNDQTSANGAEDIFAALNIPPAATGVGTVPRNLTGNDQPKPLQNPGIDFGRPDPNGTTQADVDAMMGGTGEEQMESNFDDLFFDEGMEMEDGAGMGNGEFGDMIDDWFKNAP